MTIQELKTKWNSLTPAGRRAELGASRAASQKAWDHLSVMTQMLVSLRGKASGPVSNQVSK